MTKSNGLGDKFLYAGFDLSGDVTALNGMGGGVSPLIVTSIDKSAVERIGGIRDGSMEVAAWFNKATAREHLIFRNAPTTDVVALYLRGQTLGNGGIGLVAKQADYKATRATDGAMTFSVPLEANGYGIEMGQQLTAGLRTDTGATSGTAVDGGTYGSAVTVSGASAASPTVVTAVAHGLVTGDSVVIIGTNKAALNHDWAVTVTGVDTFTVPCDLSGGAAGAGTFLKTSTNFGLSAYQEVTNVVGTSITNTLQHSADNGVTDAFAAITGAAFAAVLAATGYGSERIQTTATRTIKRYVRDTSSGTFNPATFAVVMVRHTAASIQ
jgi:hypothetical protein